MPTQRNTKPLEFEPHQRRRVVADFDGGPITSDAGTLLLRRVDRHLSVSDQVADCFTDHRDPRRSRHSLCKLVAQRIVSCLRRVWPQVKILLRADSGFAWEELMGWCEHNQVDYLFGLARNSRLQDAIAPEMAQAQTLFNQQQQPVRLFTDLSYSTLKSWSCQRRVVAKAEVLPAAPTPASSSPPCRLATIPLSPSMSRSTVPAERWKTASRNSNSTCLPIALPPTPSAPISSGS